MRMPARWDSQCHLLSNSIYENWEIIHFNFAGLMPRSRTEEARIEYDHSHNVFASCLSCKLCEPEAQTRRLPFSQNLSDRAFRSLWFSLNRRNAQVKMKKKSSEAISVVILPLKLHFNWLLLIVNLKVISRPFRKLLCVMWIHKFLGLYNLHG